MLSLALLLLASAALAPRSQVQAAVAPSPWSVPGAELKLRWRNKPYALDELPAELGPGPPAAAAAWEDWVIEHRYQMHLDAEGRVLLISSKKNGKVRRQLKLIANTSKLFEKLLPAPPREQVGRDGGEEMRPPGGAQDGGEVPEDPDGGPLGRRDKALPLQGVTYSYEWGAGTWPVDTETCVLFVVRNESDYADMLERLGELQSYLKPWLPAAKKYTGFVLEKPLIGAYIEQAKKMEEWDADNEVVNRVAQMLFVRRFSQQPYWLVQGFAWSMELKLRKGIYCYPYRSGFVWATEHTGWGAALKKRFKGREGQPLRLEEFAHWQRGSYDDGLAKISFGLAEFLSRKHKGEISGFLEELRLFRDRDNRVDVGGGRWERRVGYEIPDAELERMLVEHFGESFFEDATRFFRKGR